MNKYQHRSRSADTTQPRSTVFRDSSASSSRQEVRCACQFFQSDSLLPERTALLAASRPPSRTGMMATSRVGDHEYEPISPPPDPVPVAQPPKVKNMDIEVVEGTAAEKLKALENEDVEREKREGSHTSDKDRKFVRIPRDDELVVSQDGTAEEEEMVNKEMREIEDDDEQMSAAEFQARIEERYFTETPTTTESRTDGEFNTSQMDSSGLEDLPLHKDARRKKKQLADGEQGESQARGIQQRIRSQAGRIRTKLRNIKKPSFSMPEKRFSLPERPKFSMPERPKFSLPERPKFNLPERPKFNLPERPKFNLPERPKFHMPERPKFNLPERPKFSLPERPKISLPQKSKISLPSLSSSKAKVRSAFSSTRRPLRERSTNPSSASSVSTPRKKMFDFDFKTYPRMFERKLKSRNVSSSPKAVRAETPPPNMPFRKQGQLGNRWGKKPRFSDDENQTGSRGSRPPLEAQSSEQTEDDEFVRERQEVHESELPNIRRKLERMEANGGLDGKDDIEETQQEPMEVGVAEDNIADSDKEQQSSGSSSNRRRAGVIEEIDSDEFFVRQKGISQEDVNVGKFLTSEIRDAFRSPTNALQQMDKYKYYDDEEEAENLAHQYRGTPEREPTKPSRTRSLQTRKKLDRSTKTPSTEEENPQYFKTFPPARPKRGKRNKKKTEDKTQRSAPRYENDFDLGELGPGEEWIPLHDPSEYKENIKSDSREKSLPPSVVITDTSRDELPDDVEDQDEKELSEDLPLDDQDLPRQWQDEHQESEDHWEQEQQQHLPDNQWQVGRQLSEDSWNKEQHLPDNQRQVGRQPSEDSWNKEQQQHLPDNQWQVGRQQSEDSWNKEQQISEDRWQDEQDLEQEQWERERELSEERWKAEQELSKDRWRREENISNLPPPTPPKRRRRNRKEIIPDSMCNGHYTKEDWLENVDLHKKSEEAIALGAEPDYIIPMPPNEGYLTPPAPPRRMKRRGSRGTSLLDEDRTSRGASPLPSEKDHMMEDNISTGESPLPSEKDHMMEDLDLPAELEVVEVVDVAYASVFKTAPTKPQRTKRSKTFYPSAPRRKKKVGGLTKSPVYPHFLSLPRKAPPVRPTRNYSTLGPSRPPRRERVIHTHIEEDNKSEPYIEIDDTVDSFSKEESHGSSRDLQSGDVIEKMKGRPLPPPPRPPRKIKELHEESDELDTHLQTDEFEERFDRFKYIDESETDLRIEEYKEDSEDILQERLFSPQESILTSRPEEDVLTSKAARAVFVTAAAQQTSLEPEEISVSTQTEPLPDDVCMESLDTEELQGRVMHAHIYTEPEHVETDDHDTPSKHIPQKESESSAFPSESDSSTLLLESERSLLPSESEEKDSETAVLGRLICGRDTTPETTVVRDEREERPKTSQSTYSTPLPPPQIIQTIIEKHIPFQVLPDENSEIELLKTHKLQVSELDVERLNVGELQAHKIRVSEMEGVSMQVTELTSKSGNLVVSGLELPTEFLQELRESFPVVTQTTIILSSTQTQTDSIVESVSLPGQNIQSITQTVSSHPQLSSPSEQLQQVSPIFFQQPVSVPIQGAVLQTTPLQTVTVQSIPMQSVPICVPVQSIPIQSVPVQSVPIQQTQPLHSTIISESSQQITETPQTQSTIPSYPPNTESVHSYLPEYISRSGASSSRIPSRTHHQAQREIESEEEVITVMPSRRRRHHTSKPVTRYSSDEEEEEYSSFHAHQSRRHTSRSDMPAISDIGRQLVQACHGAALRGLHQLREYLSPQTQEGEDRKRDLQTALCIVLVLVAMLIFMGVGSGKTYHHHHWDYFFPPQS